MTSKTTARNQTQNAGQAGRVTLRVTSSNTGVYTVPDKKRTRITDILGIIDNVGSDATVALAIKRFIGGAIEGLRNQWQTTESEGSPNV